jgi:hypothetical protein
MIQSEIAVFNDVKEKSRHDQLHRPTSTPGPKAGFRGAPTLSLH